MSEGQGSRGVNFNQTAQFAVPPEQLIQAIVAGTTGQHQYVVMVVGPGTVVLTRKFRPTWATVVAVIGVFLFLVGLLALAVSETETMTVNVLPTEGGSSLTVSGVATLAMCNRLSAVTSAQPALQQGSLPGAGPTPQATTVAPGWYRDPWEPTGTRYFDGSSWTSHVAHADGGSTAQQQ